MLASQSRLAIGSAGHQSAKKTTAPFNADQSSAYFGSMGFNMHKIEGTRAIKATDDSGHIQVTPERVLGQSAIPVYGYKIARMYPHDRASYTEGLVVENGLVYEGTGLYGQSKLRKWELRTGRVLSEIDLDPHYFGEGITILNGAIIN